MKRDNTLDFYKVVYKYHENLQEIKNILGTDYFEDNSCCRKYWHIETINGLNHSDLVVYNERSSFEILYQQGILTKEEYEKIIKEESDDIHFYDYKFFIRGNNG